MTLVEVQIAKLNYYKNIIDMFQNFFSTKKDQL